MMLNKRRFGWNTIEIDGHNIDQIARACDEARETREQPTVILARTIKGKGAAYMIDKPHLHYAAPTTEQKDQTLKELGYDTLKKGR